MPAINHSSVDETVSKRFYNYSSSSRETISKRFYDYGGWSSGGARWAFFAIFIVLIVLIIVATIRVNKKRTRRGVQPIYGTRWMTPPSYIQSENQYNRNHNQEEPQSYVPTYTATANEYDMGYYDNNGVFHPNPNAKAEAAQNPSYPESAHHRTGSSAGAPPGPISPAVPAQGSSYVTDEHTSNLYHEDNIDDIYRRPSGPPPGAAAQNDAPTYDMPGSFTRPAGPPPGVAEGSSRVSETSSEASKTPPTKPVK